MWSKTLVCLAVLLALSACSEDQPDNRPSASALGEGALQGGLTDDTKAGTCVGKLVRDAGLRQDTLEHIAKGHLGGNDATWNLGEDETGAFQEFVEWEMPKKCGVKPWPPPSAAAVGEGAYRGGLMNKRSAAECVGALIRDAALGPEMLFRIADGDLHPEEPGYLFDPGEDGWVLGQDERQAFRVAVESRMLKECGAKPWPETSPWHADPRTP